MLADCSRVEPNVVREKSNRFPAQRPSLRSSSRAGEHKPLQAVGGGRKTLPAAKIDLALIGCAKGKCRPQGGWP